MKQAIVAVLCVLLVVISGCSLSQARKTDADLIKTYRDIPGMTDDEIAALESLLKGRDSFSFAHILDTESFKREDGTFAGFALNLCNQLTGLFGIEFVPVYYEEWTVLMGDFEQRTVDFTGCLTPTEERKKTMYMSAPVAGRNLRIFTNIHSPEIKDESELNSLKIGYLFGAVTEQMVREQYPRLTNDVVYFRTIPEAVELLRDGVIDAFIVDGVIEPQLEGYDFIRSRELFRPVYTPISIATANRELEPVISAIDKYLKSGGIERMSELYDSGNHEYTKYKLYKTFSAEEKAYLAELEKRSAAVNVALEHDNYPISFFNQKEGEFEGIAVDVLKEVEMLTGIRFNNVTTNKTTWAEIQEKLMQGDASVVSQLGYSDTRAEHFIWSDIPYSLNNYALISRMDYPLVSSYLITQLNVGTVEKSVYAEMYKEWFPKGENLVEYPTQNDCFDALERGDVDLVMGAEYMLLTQTNYREKTGYIINYRFDVAMESLFGFNKDETVLCSIINKAQSNIALLDIENYWNSRVFDYSKKISQLQTIYILVFAAIVFVVLIAVCILFLKNKKLSASLMERTGTLSTIYTSIPDMVFTKDKNSLFTSCNPSFERYCGFSETELIGKTEAEVFPHMPGEVKKYLESDVKVLSEGVPEITVDKIVFKNLGVRTMETIKAPLLQNEKVSGLLCISRDITERDQAKERLERIINTAQIAFVMSIDGVVVEANEYCKKHLGLKTGDSIRKLYSDHHQLREIGRKQKDNEMISNVIIKCEIANGETHRFLVSFAFVEYEQKRALIVWALDIENDEKKNDQLRSTRSSLQTILDTLPMPIRIVDAESFEIVYVNNSLLELLEYESPDELCGRNIKCLLPESPNDGRAPDDIVHSVICSGDFTTTALEYRTKTGRLIESIVLAQHIDYNGKLCSIGIIKDLTAEKERARVLLEAAEREKEANQTKSLFLANMSHEIRTPMNGIIGMTDLLLGENLSGRKLRYVKDIKASAESLLGIINDILDLSKITEGKLSINPVDTDLNSLLKNTVSMMSFAASTKGLEFIDDIRLKAPECIRVDDVRLKQIIVNLLSNAVKFTESGHVKLHAEIDGKNIIFEVSDTGIGIKREEIPLIFMAFEQADTRKNRAIKGTGLGLSISKNLVELMGGSIWVDSAYGRGSTFHVSIPYVQGDESAITAEETAFEYIFAPTAQVLLVDDIQTNLTVGAGLLRMCGITADVALSGREAIELIKSKDYDIVFMDHMMPEMDGIEAMQKIKAIDEKCAKLPIVALTANAVSESRNLLLDSGMDDFLSKPIDKRELMNILKKWLPENKIQAIKKASSEVSPVYSDVLTGASVIKGLDIELALSRIGGMQDVLEASLRQVAFSSGDRLKGMDNALSSGDMRNFAIEAHGMKGALANIGATRYSELAAELEIASKADNKKLCEEKFVIFSDVMEGFVRELCSVFSKTDAKDAKPDGDPGLLAAKTADITESLNAFEAEEALTRLSELCKYSFGSETDTKLSEIGDMIRAFKYDKAISALNSLIENTISAVPPL